MKISLLNDSYPPVIDGVANVMENYAKILHAQGNGVQVITPTVPNVETDASSWDVVRYPAIDTRKLIGYVSGVPFSPETLKRVKQFAPDVLHTHCPLASAALALSLRNEVDAPLLLTYHTKYDIDFANALKNKTMTKLAVNAIVSIINCCDEVWTVSRGAGESLRSIGYEGQYTVMPNGVDIPRTRMSAEEIARLTGTDAPWDRPLFVFVGRLMWYKGIRIILEGLKKLKDNGCDFTMVFIGKGTDEAEIKALTTKLGLDDSVRFAGAIHDRSVLCAWYCRASLMLFPSTFDTNGLVVREAAACALAAVLIKDSCAAEGTTDGQNAFLIEENAQSLFECLKKLCANPEIMAQVGENACKELYYSWDDAVYAASQRYPVIAENYKNGLYRRSSADIFKLGGTLMDITDKLRTFFEQQGE